MSDSNLPPERDSRLTHPGEVHAGSFSSKLNWLRAGVLGANDGIISQAGLLVGVAGATAASGPILMAAIAGLSAGAISMALGEYVSVSSQRDAEKDLIAKETRELADDPEIELEELTAIYRGKGLSAETAHQVAIELTEHDALAAHLDAELRMDAEDLTNPINAAIASAIAFTLGALIPTLAILIPPVSWRIPTVVASVLLALVLTGYTSARIGGGSRWRAVVRLVIGGAIAMLVTYWIGRLFGTHVA